MTDDDRRTNDTKETRRTRRRPVLVEPPLRTAQTLPAPPIDRPSSRPSAAPVSERVRTAPVVREGTSERTLVDLRAILERDPAHRLVRFRYVVTLLDAGHAEEAVRQVRVLRRILLINEPSALAEDGVTSVAELLDAVRALEERLA